MNKIFYYLDSVDTSQGAAENPWYSTLMMVGMIALMGLAFYFLLIRPQKKQQKQQDEIRGSVSKGDVITTKGGIVGIVVNIKDDMLLIQTGGEKTTIQVQKWSVATIEMKSKSSEGKTDND